MNLLGRERESQALQGMLAGGVRLITLRGPGGIGKTALARHLIRILRSAYDHVLFVDLSALRDSQQVLSTIAANLPQSERQDSPLNTITQFASRARLLLILDNFEQLLPAAGDIARLLEATDTLQVLVTSRAPLHLHEEYEYPIEPLALPAARKIAESPAVKFFVQRVRVTQPTFELSETNAPEVARMVEVLEGVPLAIELAAARLRTYALSDLLTKLEHPLKLLKADFRDRPERLRSLRAAVQWSYDLLSDEDREVFECCAVFHGSFAPEALSAAWGSEDVLDLVESLIEQSFLTRIDGPVTRWKLLQPLRELALEKLPEHPQAPAWLERHARYYLSILKKARQGPPGHPAEVREQYLPDYPNIRAGLTWAIEHQQSEIALRYLDGMPIIWVPFGLYQEGHDLTQRVLALPTAGLEHLRPRALHTLLQCLLELNQPEAFEAKARELLEVSRAQGNALHELYGYMGVALKELRTGRNADSVRTSQALIERCRELLAQGAAQRPAGLTDAKLHHIVGQTYNNATLSLLELGEYAQALEFATTAREHYRQAGTSLYDTAGTMIGVVQEHLGDFTNAARWLLVSLRFVLQREFPFDISAATKPLSRMAAARGEDQLAVRLAAFAARTYQGTRGGHYLQSRQEQTLTQLQERMGEAAFQQAWKDGEQLTPEEVLGLAENFASSLAEKPTSAGAELITLRSVSHDLTARELEVLALVVQGHPDRRIAKLLNVSPATASKHVGNMLSKLGLRNRVELARWAIEQGVRA